VHKYLLIPLCLFAMCFVQAQDNIVPNQSFELYSKVPQGWFYNGQHFTSLVKFWNSPTPASPDAYGQGVIVPRHWKEKGFGLQLPFHGNSMVGMTLYGCDNGKAHCKEYIQIRLKEPMVIGQRYHLSFWTSHMTKSVHSNNLGVLFTENSIHYEIDELIEEKPQLNIKNIVTSDENNWINISHYFIADKAFEFMLVGNFYPDKETEVVAMNDSVRLFSYYYFDDFRLKKTEPIIEFNEVNKFSTIKINEGVLIKLENIYFDYDKAEFLIRSYKQLDRLVSLMKENPNLIIEIHGHTDGRGKKEYNMELSIERAKAVASYLNKKGIYKSRTKYKGFGSQRPIDSNLYEQGRQKNRRVEFLILSK